MGIQLYQYHPIIGYQFIPNLKARLEHESGGYLVRINSAGFRSEREFVREKAAGKFRVLLFGDSYTAGEAVSNKYRFGDVLETLFLDNLEVYNFGLPGTGTDQQYLVYKEVAKDYEHDLIVIAAQVENIRRVAARHRLWYTAEGTKVFAKPYFELEANGETLTLKNVPVPKGPINPEDLPEEDRALVDQGGRMFWLRQIVGKMGGRAKELALHLSHYQPLPEYNDPNGREWLLMKAILRQWTSEIKKPIIVMPIPLYHYVEETASPKGYLDRFGEITDWKNITLHNPLPDYYAVPKAERRALRFETDIHPTPAHHRLLAESLAKAVQRELKVFTAEVAAIAN
jgi:lysophospholipase L1-like esterase